MLLKDKSLQEQLKRDGYIIIPFLNDAELKALNGFYETVHNHQEPPNFIENIHMTSWCKEADYKQTISNGLQKIFSEPAELFFNNYRRLNNVFIVKRSGQETTFKVHQDWNIIDEKIYESVNVWVPLHDVDEKSGALWILKGSHNINRKVRGAGYLFPDYGKYLNELQSHAISVKLKAGEAVVFYHSVIHGSPPNYSGTHRIAACFSVIPKEAPLCIYYQPSPTDNLEQYEPVDEFIFEYDYLRTESLSRPPASKPVKIFEPYENKKVDLKDLQSFIKPKRNFFSFLGNKN